MANKKRDEYDNFIMKTNIQEKKQNNKYSKLSKQAIRENAFIKKEEEKSKIKKLTPPPPKIS